jgi:nitrous oxidase accessory protein NosD
LLSGAALHVENVVIYGFTSRGIDVAPTATVSVMIKNTLLRENNIGIALLPSAGSVYATLDGVSSNHNSAHGIYVGNNSHAMIRKSTFDSNASVGVYVEQSTGSADASLDDCVIFGSPFGIYAGSGASVTRISNVTVTGNTNGLYFNGGTIVSYSNNRISGNAGGNGPASSNIGQQ